MKKKLLLLTIIMSVIITACGGKENKSEEVNTNSENTIKLKLSQTSAQDGAIGKSLEKLAEEVKEKTNGEVEIQVFHNGQMGTERDNVEAIQLNNLDIAVVNNSVLANFIDWFSAFDLPYVIKDYEMADKVFMGDIKEDMRKSMNDINIIGLGVWESGFRNLTNSKKDINTFEDVKGLRIRVMENTIHQDLWKSLGADPVPMSWSDAYTGMQQGAIDGQENPTTVIDKNNVVEVNKKMALTKHVYSTVSLIMSKGSWEMLGEKNQKILMDCIAESEKYERELSRKMDEEAIESLKEEGMVITEPDLDGFVEKTKGVREKHGSEYKEILDKIEKMNK